MLSDDSNYPMIVLSHSVVRNSARPHKMVWVLESLTGTLLPTAVGGSPCVLSGLGRLGEPFMPRGYMVVSSGCCSQNLFLPHKATSQCKTSAGLEGLVCGCHCCLYVKCKTAI